MTRLAIEHKAVNLSQVRPAFLWNIMLQSLLPCRQTFTLTLTAQPRYDHRASRTRPRSLRWCSALPANHSPRHSPN